MNPWGRTRDLKVNTVVAHKSVWIAGPLSAKFAGQKSEPAKMYVPDPYAETRREVLIDAVNRRSFGTLITLGSEGIDLTHIPFVPLIEADGNLSLLGHVARPNAQWNRIDPRVEAVAAFVVDSAYISPNWYPTKAQTGRMVPTWNYIAVEARGPLDIVHDPDGLLAILKHLTDRHEAGRPKPWSVSEAPQDYTAALLKGIVGMRLRVRELKGSWKLDQKKSEKDRQGAIDGLAANPETRSMATAMAERMK